MSVVTRCRRTFSSRVTHLRAIPAFLAVKSPVSPCILIMSLLLTVAIVNVVCASAGPEARKAMAAIAAHARGLIPTSQCAERLLHSARRVSICPSAYLVNAAIFRRCRSSRKRWKELRSHFRREFLEQPHGSCEGRPAGVHQPQMKGGE